MSRDSPVTGRASVAQIYRAALERNDGPFDTYVSRPLGSLVVYALLETRVAPNQVTFFSGFMVVVAAVVFLALPWPLGLLVGVVLVEVAYVFEKAGGMLARARGEASAVQRLLELVISEIKAFLVLAAVAAGAFQQRGRSEALLLGLTGVVCLASRIVMSTFLQRPEVFTAVANEAAPPVDQSEPPIAEPSVASKPRLAQRLARAADGLGRFSMHYPSYLWVAALLSDSRVFVYPYVAANAVYGLRSLAVLLWSYGGWAPPSAETLTSLRRAVELVEQESDDIG